MKVSSHIIDAPRHKAAVEHEFREEEVQECPLSKESGGFTGGACLGRSSQLLHELGSRVREPCANSVNILAIDAAGPGQFNVGQTALDILTNGQAVALGATDVDFYEVPAWECGL